jgi:hypothetical protein
VFGTWDFTLPQLSDGTTRVPVEVGTQAVVGAFVEYVPVDYRVNGGSERALLVVTSAPDRRTVLSSQLYSGEPLSVLVPEAGSRIVPTLTVSRGNARPVDEPVAGPGLDPTRALRLEWARATTGAPFMVSLSVLDLLDREATISADVTAP